MINNIILKLAAEQKKIERIKYIESAKVIALTLIVLIVLFGGFNYGLNRMSVYR